MKRKLFLSYDVVHDAALREFAAEQATRDDSPFSLFDWSSPGDHTEDGWQRVTEAAIGGADVVLVLVGRETHRSRLVAFEVGAAHRLDKVVINVVGYLGLDPKPVPGAGQLFPWDWDLLKAMLS